MDEKDCTFLVNLINQENLKAIPYESFIDFIIPHTNKKLEKPSKQMLWSEPNTNRLSALISIKRELNS